MNGLTQVVPGMLLGLGIVLTVLAFRPQHARLADALAVLADETPDAIAHDIPDGERVGAWLLARRPSLVSDRLLRQLELRGRSVTAHLTTKATWALAVFLAPLVLGLVLWIAVGTDPSLPLIVSLVGAVVGFMLPDLQLRGEAHHVASDATEALLTYFDLVTLERLANQSATQALHSAAGISDIAIFRSIRAALDRARLEQRMPFAELKVLGRQLELPALTDLADVMSLDESGAALTAALRARVKELRDAHLTELKLAAAVVSERMTFFMVIPSLVFGLLFLVPPLLRLVLN